MKPEPLAGQKVDHIDVGPLDKSRQSLARRAADLRGLELGPAKHGVVHGRHPEPIVQTGQGRFVPGFPKPAQPDDSHTEPHVLRPDQAVPPRDAILAHLDRCRNFRSEKIISLPHPGLPKFTDERLDRRRVMMICR